MKKNIWMLLLAIILLAIQAFGIVALPEYISKIVDVGIRSYGIENAVPIAIRESEIENLKLFIKNKEVLNNFEVMGPKEFINLGKITHQIQGEHLVNSCKQALETATGIWIHYCLSVPLSLFLFMFHFYLLLFGFTLMTDLPDITD